MTNLLIKNTEIESQAHKMWAEGSCDLQPNDFEIIAFMIEQKWAVRNVIIFYDTMQHFWRWNCDLVCRIY